LCIFNLAKLNEMWLCDKSKSNGFQVKNVNPHTLDQQLCSTWAKKVVGKNYISIQKTCNFLQRSQSFAFSALMLLVGRQEGHPACKNWVVRYWRGYLSGARCIWFEYGPADATATPSSLAPVKWQNGLPFWRQLTQVVLEKTPLNGCSVVLQHSVISVIGTTLSGESLLRNYLSTELKQLTRGDRAAGEDDQEKLLFSFNDVDLRAPKS